MPNVITKDEVKAEIDRLPQDQLEALYHHLKRLSASQEKKISRETFMERMRKIKIDAPPDFATNIDQYMNGEKTLD